MTKGRAPQPLLPPVECDNCGGPVKQRRPSRSGMHFCTQPECRKARNAKTYQDRIARRKLEAEAAAATEALNLVAFLGAVANRPRVTCQNCGLVNALPGYSHRGPAGAPCRGTGGPIPGVGVNHIDAVWPNPREYAEVSS